ncbi:MAG: nuclear transport factor 2 family protein [Verrucomicrobiota bacterium]|nr:nuclear transport factor 2 family protein [Verrucomicrobiota bacterium]
MISTPVLASFRLAAIMGRSGYIRMKLLLPFLLTYIFPVTAFAQRSPAAAASPSPSGTSGKGTEQHASSLPPPAPAPEAEELIKLLKEFLTGASRNDVAMHERFWADDLIYTRSAGVRIGKADVMRNVREEAAAGEGGEATTYTAEEIRVQQYGTTALVAFRLVGASREGEKTEVANYLNTGTFLKREGKWQAVAWQATKVPTEAEAKK